MRCSIPILASLNVGKQPVGCQDIDGETFLVQKDELLSKKKQLQEIIKNNENGKMPWIEPFKKWVNNAKTLGEIALPGSPKERETVASEVFGLNLFLNTKKARGYCIKRWSLILENDQTGGVVPAGGIEPPTKGL